MLSLLLFSYREKQTRSRQTLSSYADLLATMAPESSGYSVDDFLQHCRDEGISVKQVDDHRQLFLEIRELDLKNKNGVWPRIIKNAFAPLFIKSVDFVAGNPPWVNWDSLPEDYRNDTKGLWLKNKLFTLSGTAGRLGGGKKDISMLFVYECIRSYLKPCGKLGFVITQSLFKTEGAADGFRQFELPAHNGRPRESFCVWHVDDMSRLRPFAGAANRTAVICVKREGKTNYPLVYDYWLPRRSSTINSSAQLDEVLVSTKRVRLIATPVYEEKLNAPWLTVCPSSLEPLRKVIGKSSYVAQAGATTCGADGVFLCRPLRKLSNVSTLIENIHDVGKRKIPKYQGQVKNEYLYPVCRGKDIYRWRAKPELFILMVQDPFTRQGIAPGQLKKHRGTWDYLNGFKPYLAARKSSMLPKLPFYSIYGVGPDTFAPFKVVWGRVGNTVAAAVISTADCCGIQKVALPFEAMMVAFDRKEEAHFVCGCLNASPAQLVVIGSIVLHPDTHVLRRVNVPRFSPKNQIHAEIAKLSRVCHDDTVSDSLNSLKELEAKLDEACGHMWGINRSEFKSIRDCLVQIRGVKRQGTADRTEKP